MSDRPSRPGPDDTSTGTDRGPAPGAPRWVKVFGIITLVAILLFVVLVFAGGGRHGPGRHMPRGDAGGQAPAEGTRP